ncbi:cytochrome P450 [Mycobacterium koreense]|uniref:Cytochrome P450 n=1 Tax=Mycolicibacillus koreensis TaxID=1069220 RepID=A0A7I7SDT7_9MYCO|nr:cytochrome P450 [Mycolicibacillus koreensis]MCV7247741.1 cytochrome P450 [Mycolicibacillus koreensis]OSC34734.1 cytochrome P450 [Mycolicibacillus koreensis]BBY54125.1 cytochrome P450 [Mycolicibacillus koreensis]
MSAAPEPFPRPSWRLPVLGDLLRVDMSRPAQGIADDIAAFDGLMEQRIFDISVVCVSRSDLVDEINDEAHWEKHVGHSLRKLRPVSGDGLFTAYNHEPNWAKAHNILMPLFTKAAMQSYHRSMLDTAGELVDAWAQRAGGWVEIPTSTNRLTTEIVARAGFGHSFNKLSDVDDDPFLAAVIRELTYANRRTDAIPYYDKVIGSRRRDLHRRDKAWLRERVKELVDARREAGPGGEGGAMLDAMLHSPDPDTGEKLDEKNIINQVLTMLVAGSETSANTIAFALHFLARDPQLAREVRAEVDAQLAGRDIGEIGFDEVAKMRLLRRVIDETLRLWPTAPGYFRQAKHDTTIGGGRYRFRAGDWVFVVLLAAHRDRAWGDDADEFNPDRFLTENLRSLPPRVYKPFGTGARACIGRQFALHEIALTLAAVLQRFDLEYDPRYRLTVKETITLKPDGLRLRFNERR